MEVGNFGKNNLLFLIGIIVGLGVVYVAIDQAYSSGNVISSFDCVDSDGGLNYYVYGSTTYRGSTVYDKCAYTTYVIERYCHSYANDIKKPYAVKYKCVGGCSNGRCGEKPCTDECSSSGLKECISLGNQSGYRTCGNYDTDSCFEWSNIEYCPANYACESGVCIAPQKDTTIDFEGFGAETIGGEGKKVYTAKSALEFTTILNGIKASSGNAVINLEGNWVYKSNVNLRNMKYVTLNGTGSSVVFDGISVYLINSQNIILQGIRVRNHGTGDDGIQVNSCKHVIIDHCSVSKSGDGAIDITGYSYGASEDITVSWSILADTWKQSLVKYNNTTRVSFHHNLFYNGGLRMPDLHEGIFDLRNNVMWQWGSYGTGMRSAAKVNIVNNYYKISPTSTRGHATIYYIDGTAKAWISGNVLPSQEKDVSRLTAPLEVPKVVTQSAEEAKNLVLTKAGAYPRDSYDLTVINNVMNNVFPELPPYVD